jgi:hypothetical protein
MKKTQFVQKYTFCKKLKTEDRNLKSVKSQGYALPETSTKFYYFHEFGLSMATTHAETHFLKVNFR